MTDVSVCATGDFDKGMGVLVCCIDSGGAECKTYPNLLFGHNIVDGRGVMCSVLTLDVGNNQGMDDVEYGEICGDYFPPEFLRLFGGPSCDIVGMMT